jgi:hypothetical protein
VASAGPRVREEDAREGHDGSLTGHQGASMERLEGGSPKNLTVSKRRHFASSPKILTHNKVLQN